MRSYLFIALLFCFQHAFAQDPPEKFMLIWTLVNTSEPADPSVLAELKNIREENPSDPWIFWISGIYCNPVNGQEEAAAFYKQAIVADSTFPHAYYNLAQTIDDNNENGWRERIGLYTKAVTYDPSLGYSFHARGEAYFELGDYKNAMADCDSARKCYDFDPMLGDALELKILWKQNKKQEAFALAREANFNEGMWGTDFDILLAAVYTEMGDQKRACLCYHRAAEPYEMMGEKLPAEIKKGLKKCK
ncbi:MAG: hypothetical protein V4604_06925 [Bacteroidota bacterium]